jgi:hypothetical protein
MILQHKLFNQNLNEQDFEELKRLSSKDVKRSEKYLKKRNIFVIQDFYKSCKTIFTTESFDLIILDVDFPPAYGKALKSDEVTKAKELFMSSHLSQNKKIIQKLEKTFNYVVRKKEFSGLLLFFIICLFYERERKILEIAERICIFTQNNVTFKNFTELMDTKESLYQLEIGKYVQEVEKRFWFKNQDFEKLKDFIELDKYAEILRDNLGVKFAKKFVKIEIEKNDNTLIAKNLTEIRKIYEAILEACVEKIPGMKQSYCINEYGDLTSKGKQTIDWLQEKGHINSIHRNLFFAINKICSSFGAHNSEDGYQASIDTVNSLFYALKDTILWFDKIFKKPNRS